MSAERGCTGLACMLACVVAAALAYAGVGFGIAVGVAAAWAGEGVNPWIVALWPPLVLLALAVAAVPAATILVAAALMRDGLRALLRRLGG